MSETDRVILHYINTEGARTRAPFPGESQEDFLKRRQTYVDKLSAVARKLGIKLSDAVPDGCHLTFDDGQVFTTRVAQTYSVKER